MLQQTIWRGTNTNRLERERGIKKSVPNANNERKELTFACKEHLLYRNFHVSLCGSLCYLARYKGVHPLLSRKCCFNISHHFTSHISLVSNISMKV